jgi:sugar phosphate isomerase/epimerase
MPLRNPVCTLLVVVFFHLISSALGKDGSATVNTSHPWPVTSYNFGGLEKLSPQDQIDLLHRSGYDGIILRCATEKNFQNLDRYIQAAERTDHFKIDAVFERYNFKDSAQRRERWKQVVDKISGKKIQLWVIFGKKTQGVDDAFIERKLREIVTYAAPKGVEVILYPHSSCYIESAEEALPFVEKINHPHLKLAFHLYHEIRAKNGLRLGEVMKRIQHRLGAVTLAGTDRVADYSSPRARDKSTIKPLGQGDYDMKELVRILKNSGYTGSVGLMNFHIQEAPKNYLPRSIKIWRRYQEQALQPARPPARKGS